MRILKTAELETKSIFIGWKLVTTTFLLFPYSNYSRPTGSLFTKSEIPAKSAKPSSFEAEGLEAFEICRFSERCLEEYVFDIWEVCENQNRQKNVPKEYTLNVKLTKILSVFGGRGLLAWSTLTHGHILLFSCFELLVQDLEDSKMAVWIECPKFNWGRPEQTASCCNFLRMTQDQENCNYFILLEMEVCAFDPSDYGEPIKFLIGNTSSTQKSGLILGRVRWNIT